MKRNLEQIQRQQFDLVVIGGGIQGAVICYKAAQRGLRVLLLEKGDFCGSSSANSLKILHGGLRYLQSLDFRRMRDSIRSRREMMCMAPHLVTPLACVMPAYGHGLKGKEVMRVAMLINDFVSMDRNTGLLPEKRLPAGHTLSKLQCLEQAPGIPVAKLHGASVWYDALAINTERLVFEYILQAADRGALCINYLAVKSLRKNAEGSIAVNVSDQLSSEEFAVSAEHVINSAGAAFEDLLPGVSKKETAARWARGLNVVVKKKLFPDAAVALEKKFNTQKRMLFMVPWREKYTLIGTHYVEQSRKAGLFPVDRADIMALVDEINAIYPPAKLKFEDVSFYHAGLLPIDDACADSQYDAPLLAKESTIIDHGKADGFSRFFSIKGIKYTTAPQVAERILKLIGAGSAHSDKALTRLNSSASEHGVSEQGPSETDTEIDIYLRRKYGARAALIKPYTDSSPAWLDSGHSLLAGELEYFMREEMALHLSDVIFRRTDLGTAACPRIAVLQEISRRMADFFSWSDQRQSSELKQVLQRYAPLVPTQ